MKIQMLSLGLLGLCFSVGCSHQRELASSESASSPFSPFVDAHVHLHEGEGVPFAEGMKPVAVVAHASLAKPLDEAPAVPGVKIVTCAAIADTLKLSDLEPALKSKKVGCLKVYLGYVHRWATDRRYRAYYRMAEKYRVPVVFHTGDTLDKGGKVKYADPLTIDEVAVDFPKVTFVIAHIGNPWTLSAAEVVYKNDNVYADLSALLLGDMDKLDPHAVEELVVKPIRQFSLYVENPKKILFGTDYPLLEIGPYMKAVQRAIPKKDWPDVFYGNANRVFRLGLPERDTPSSKR